MSDARRTFDQDAAHRARRVLAGTQTGSYTKRKMASDILAMSALLEAHRYEYQVVAEEAARDYTEHPNPAHAAWVSLSDFEEEVLAEHAERVEEDCGRERSAPYSPSTDTAKRR